MRIPLLTIMLIIFSVPAFCQVVTVMDAATRRPLPGATISSKVPSAFAVTGPDGRADISDFRDSEAIEIRSTGHSTAVMSYDSILNTDLEIRLYVSTVALGQVVISASGWEEDKRKVSRYIVPIKKETVAFLNPQTTADLLGTSGSVFIQKSQQGGGSPMIRGFATSRLLYSVDGVRMNTAIFRSGNIQNVISLDPFAIESTEVLFGPGSVAYGSDAIGGVMRFKTLSPALSTSDELEVHGRGALRYSSANNEQTAHADINLGWKKWALLSSFSNFNFDDLRMGSDGPDSYLRNFIAERSVTDTGDVVISNPDPRSQVPTGYSQVNFMQKVRFAPSAKLNIQYAFHYSETSAYGRYDRLLRVDTDGLPEFVEWSYGPQLWMMNHLELNIASQNAFIDKATIRLAHQRFEESRISRRFNRDQRQTREEEVDAISANLDFVKQINRSKIYYGAEFVRNDVRSVGTNFNIVSESSEMGPARYPNADWTSAGVYGNISHGISDLLTFNGGLRYNFFALNADFSNNTDFFPFPFDEASNQNGNFTGSVGLAYQPGERLTLSLLGATGFRSPNVDDVGKVFDSEQGAVVVPNPNLDAEYVYNAEVGMSWLLSETIKIDFTAYYSLLNKAMVRRDFTLNGQDSIFYDGELSRVQAIQNAADARIFGIQAAVEARFESGVYLESTYNYQNGTEEMDDGTSSPSRHAAPAFGTTRLGYKTGPIQLEAFAVYSAEVSYENLNREERGKPEIYAVNSDGNPYSPSWYTLNVKLSYRFKEGLLLGGGVENITDQRYRPYSSGLIAPGRNLVLSIRAEF